MSLVGTRPILQDELQKYELHHRARIAIKPGITGMWQVSGRSDITDFEEVVRLDTEYISNWTFGLDIKILFKTVMTVLKIATLICTLMYMFFFLSGFGCYYSLNKSNNTRKFYANRIKKVLLPYLEISLIAYAIKYFVLEFSVCKFIEAMFFISFWVKNEGAWYIAVVLILYVIYPLLYNIQKSQKGKLNIIALLLIILCITLLKDDGR